MRNERKPVRIQRRRTKGWRMPENTVYVGRGSKWGNPWTITPGDASISYRFIVLNQDDYSIPSQCFTDRHKAHASAVDMYERTVLIGSDEEIAAELGGKNLACWCPLDMPCHADVLLELANGEVRA